MKKWWTMVGIVAVAVVILAVCLYGLPFDTPAVYPSGTGNSQLGTTLPPETTEETLPWNPLGEDASVYKYYLTSPEAPNHDYEINRQVLPETVDNPDGLPILNWVCLVRMGNKVLNEAAAVELNQMLADRNLPCRVQFTILSTSKHIYPWDWFSRPEIQKELENADLIYGYYTYKEMEEWLLPIANHIYGDAQPSLADALPDPLSWFSVESNGEIYGIPDQVSVGRCQGWSVDVNFMDEFGLTFEDFNRNFWEMDELFAEIYEKNGNQPFIYDGFSGSSGGVLLPDAVVSCVPMPAAFTNSDYQGICMCFSIDLQAEKPTVVNMLETDRFSKFHGAALRYLNAGYMTKERDYAISYTAFIDATEPYQSEWLGQEYYYIPCTSIGLQSLSYAYMTGISANTAYQEQALSLLESIITDDALRLQLCYGKEGRDYTLTEGVYSLVTQEDGSCYYMDYLSPQAAFFEFTSADEGTGRLVCSTSGSGIKKREGMTRLESYKEHLAQASFSYCPVVFDCSVLDDELLALEQVLKDYYPMFGITKRYTEEYYQRMLRDMEEAGMDTVITELQRQLDAWIAEHPDWDPLN